ncbi:glycosyltransferase family 4 protein [Candidatus Berkelbacteria bacterium CG06_land_8_20_14_3_00_43_10]|uniref:Glycosyltransferase family 4 protein n=1 Tax=Candidatus Berkelbacteria bacterium CG10_big_fil_rev_8_21_14_0_10_43_14 TaxID=1974515 RepID=A0A2M6RA58_9BACT|nr:MAG: glycosyltransferase family 4 protein [Candidatus Berkelbacteria bacterium CG10_big_fil_rev_8_21_14_0_10_43_14]PIU87276.1 MAG: glycosyltransferase family 4 protein [Candidatus Berkelbacteria bacterium CG06_land_8_20_14_3_00_43_10]
MGNQIELKKLKVAIVHDFLMQVGGAEKILESFVELFPQAEVFTMVADQKNITNILPHQKVHLSFLQNIPGNPKNYKLYLGLMPMATQSFDLSEFDLVLSNTSAFVKGVITDTKKTVHICYLNTPTRYLWDITDFYLKTAVPRYAVPFVKLLLPYLRRWDQKAATRPDYIIANSRTIAKRTKRVYKREADTYIFPFANIKKFDSHNLTSKEYYLLAGRLVPYKRNDIVIEAFNILHLPLHVVGTGYDEERLKKLNTNPRTQFFGRLSDAQLVKQYQECRAYIFPALEDFGITPVEAMAAGRPVIAFGQGGATETVVAGKTGLFFKHQTKEDVVDAVTRFQSMRFNSHNIRIHALQFSRERFKKEIEAFILKVLLSNQKRSNHGSV